MSKKFKFLLLVFCDYLPIKFNEWRLNELGHLVASLHRTIRGICGSLSLKVLVKFQSFNLTTSMNGFAGWHGREQCPIGWAPIGFIGSLKTGWVLDSMMRQLIRFLRSSIEDRPRCWVEEYLHVFNERGSPLIKIMISLRNAFQISFRNRQIFPVSYTWIKCLEGLSHRRLRK